jgi:hypothetical protein
MAGIAAVKARTMAATLTQDSIIPSERTERQSVTVIMAAYLFFRRTVTALPPKLVDRQNAGGDYIRHRRKWLVVTVAIDRSHVEIGLASQHYERQHHHAGFCICCQWLPCLWRERNRIEEATRRISGDHIALRPLPEERVELFRVIVEAGDDLVVAAHDGSKDRPHLVFSFKLRLIPTQITGSHSPGGVNSGLTTMSVKKPSRSDRPMQSSGAWSDNR